MLLRSWIKWGVDNKPPAYVIKQGRGKMNYVDGVYFSKIIFLVWVRLPACMLLPPSVWVLFATVLTLNVWMMN
jgi:hypothetical protein